MDLGQQERQALGILTKAEQFQKQKQAMGIQNDYKDFMGGVVGDAVYQHIEGGEELRGTMQVVGDAYHTVEGQVKRINEEVKGGVRKLAYRTGEKIFQNQEQMMERAAQESMKAMVKEGAKETGKAIATETTQIVVEGGTEVTATVAGGTAGPLGLIIGFAVGEVTGSVLDITGTATSDRRRLERFMVDKITKGDKSEDRLWKVLVENTLRWLLLDLKYRFKSLFMSILPLFITMPFVVVLAVVSILLFIFADPLAFGLTELAELLTKFIS